MNKHGIIVLLTSLTNEMVLPVSTDRHTRKANKTNTEIIIQAVLLVHTYACAVGWQARYIYTSIEFRNNIAYFQLAYSPPTLQQVSFFLSILYDRKGAV